jgi:hypothetical protein
MMIETLKARADRERTERRDLARQTRNAELCEKIAIAAEHRRYHAALVAIANAYGPLTVAGKAARRALKD